ncbi:MAG: hypothetical protein JSU85_05010 [Candidatus Zixiibacteriota bacterium]|nr:MAG: hypothetical protein JSU85_05010 [candidate division Zixibacteria bacterium]
MRRYVFLMAAPMLFVIANSASADVMIKSKAAMGQMLGIGGSESETSVYIKGDKNRTETTTSFKSQMFQMSKQDMTSRSTEIIRLDKEVKWQLEDKDKSYREIFLKSLKPSIGDYKGQESSPAMSSPDDEAEDYTWTVTVDISENGEVVNGFKSNKAVVNAIGVNKEDVSDTMFVTLKMWRSEELPNIDEIEDFHKKFSEIAGFDEDVSSMRMEEYSSGFGKEFEESAKKIEQMEGYQVKTEMVVQKSSSGEGGDEESDMSGMMKGLMGVEKGPGEESGSDRITVISITDEIISVDNSKIDDGMFEIPEGYIRKE